MFLTGKSDGAVNHHLFAQRRRDDIGQPGEGFEDALGDHPTKRLEQQLVPDDVWDWSDTYSECEYLQSEVQHLIKWLDSEIQDLTFELEWGPDWREAIRLNVGPRTLAERWKTRSPFEWVAGHYLPEVFRTHFGTTATFHRRKGVPDSPAIRFIEQALIELGITDSGRAYARESIAKALSDVRSGRVRRKLKG